MSGPPSGLQDTLDRVASSDEFYPVSISAQEGERLRQWVAGERARHTIEVGLGYGVSALYICAGLTEVGVGGRHTAMDPFQAPRFEDRGLSLLAEAGVADMLELHRERSEIVLPRLLAEGRQYDLAFVDGNHRFDWVFVDLVYLGRLVRPGGVIFVDDYHLPSAKKATAFFEANLGWSLEDRSTADPMHGWAVMRTPIEPLDRHFAHFVDF